jgi:hypothetical protein
MNKDYTMAVISDTNSNVYALEAVLSDIDSRGIKTIVNLGDTLFSPIVKRMSFKRPRPLMPITSSARCQKAMIQDLIEMNGFYTELYNSQFAGAAI